MKLRKKIKLQLIIQSARKYSTNSILLAVFILFVGSIGLYYSTIVRNPYTVLYPSALVTGSLVFLIVRNRNLSGLFRYNSNLVKGILITYFIVLGILIYAYHNFGYWRTDIVIELTILLYIIVGFYIFITSFTNAIRSTSLGLGLILITGLINRMTAYYSSERYVGVDIYQHNGFISSIIVDGSLQPLYNSKYFFAPLYHIQAVSGEMLLQTSIKDAMALSTMISVLVVPVLVVYLLTTMIWGPRTGLISSLLYVSSDQAIKWSIHLTPTSLGIVFFSLATLGLIRYLMEGDLKQYVVFAGLILALTFTHQMSLFIATVATLTIAMAAVLYRNWSIESGLNIIVSVGLVVILNFITTKFRGPNGDASFLDVVIEKFVFDIVTAGIRSRPEVSFPIDSSISPSGAAAMAEIQLAGSTLLLVLAIIGVLYGIFTKRDVRSIFVLLALGMSIAVMMGIALGGPVVGLRNLLPYRWWPFIFVFLSVPAAGGVMLIIQLPDFNMIPTRSTQLVIIIVILVPFIVLMVGSSTGSMDNPYIESGFDAERYAITEQEMSLITHLNDYSNGEVKVRKDVNFAYYGPNVAPIQMKYSNPNSIAKVEPQLLINREYTTTKPAMYHLYLEDKLWVVHGGVPINEVHPTNKAPVYNSGEDELLWMKKVT